MITTPARWPHSLSKSDPQKCFQEAQADQTQTPHQNKFFVPWFTPSKYKARNNRLRLMLTSQGHMAPCDLSRFQWVPPASLRASSETFWGHLAHTICLEMYTRCGRTGVISASKCFAPVRRSTTVLYPRALAPTSSIAVHPSIQTGHT